MPSFSGLWNNEHGENHSLLSSSVKIGNSNTALSRVFANRIYGRGAARAVLNALIGAAAGGTATATHKRIAAERDLEANVQGGKRTIETMSSVNRVTTTADADALKNALALSSKPTYATDRSGIGGGGKLGW